MSNKDTRKIFTARFDRYERTNQNTTKFHIRDLSIKNVLIAESYVFDEEDTNERKISRFFYREGDYIAFESDIKLVNIDF